jgi:tetratricopeptide (TPR) repeat protein
MTKPGRNDPCPCGSGKKYKRCCFAKDQEAEHAALIAAMPAAKPPRPPNRMIYPDFDDEDDLTPASNAVVDLVDAGKLDEAEQAARDLLERFPEVHDGFDRLAMVYEARGDHKQAAHYYRKSVEVICQDPEHDPDFAEHFRKLADKLDPPAAN